MACPTSVRPYSMLGSFRLLLLGLAAVVANVWSCPAQQPAPYDPSDIAVPLPAATLRVSVRRVLVDIVVTDTKGKPIGGLSPDDFRLSEDGKPQSIRSFDAHVPDRLQPPSPLPTLPQNTFSNLARGPQSGPITVILYDLLNTPLDSQAFAHDQLLQFLKQRKASGQTAIFVLSDKLHMLQGFTDDENQLIAALNSGAKTPAISNSLQATGQASQQSDDLARTDGSQSTANPQLDSSFQAVSSMLKHMETTESSALLDRRVFITADALQEISRFLIGLPGRKNLLWLSASFPSGILPDGSLNNRDSADVVRNYSQTIMQASDLLNLSHVAVYPVDVRGLQANPMFSAAGRPTFEPGTGKDLQAVKDFSQQSNAEHSTMDSMAEETGGHAFYNTNGLKEAVASAAEDGSTYYTLTYSPTNRKLDGGLRNVRVSLAGGPGTLGYKLSYRRSYFADRLDERALSAADHPTENAVDPLEVTLEHGAPAARELYFEAHLQTYGPPTAATPEQLQILNQYEASSRSSSGANRAPVHRDTNPVMMQRYLITYGLLMRQLTLTNEANGDHRGNLDFAVISYSDDGLALNGIRSKIADVIHPERYAHLKDSGYQVLQTIAVPVNAAFLRLAVQDKASGQLGSTELRLPLPPPEANLTPKP